MKFALIICTFRRAEALRVLLDSVLTQSLYPDEILVVDGSDDGLTASMLAQTQYPKLRYWQVDAENRGLTRQRNFGIRQVDPTAGFIAFLDDDTKLEPDYFKRLELAFREEKDAVGIGGIAINETLWTEKEEGRKYDQNRFFEFDGFITSEGLRNRLRNRLGLMSDLEPGRMPSFSHGRSSHFPLTGKRYEVDLLIGMSFAFRKSVFDSISFSPYFEGYGLYEDADFSIRALQFGRNLIDTSVQLSHYHHPSGRPNQYRYGKMVVRNGWYVWRVRHPRPSLKARLKWNMISLLLTIIRFSNTFTTNARRQAFTEAMGRTVGWWSLLIRKPKHQ